MRVCSKRLLCCNKKMGVTVGEKMSIKFDRYGEVVCCGDPTLLSSIILASLIRSLMIPTIASFSYLRLILLFFGLFHFLFLSVILPFIDCTHHLVLLILLSVVTFFVCFYVNNCLMRRYST